MAKHVVMIRRNRGGPRKSRARIGWRPVIVFLLVALGTAVFAIVVLGF
jgi:hypothetical protein